MIFARGVRFIRFMSSSVSGRLSGSLVAAACFFASVIASRRLQSCLAAALFLGVLFMLSTSLMRFCFSDRNDPHGIVSDRVGDDQQPVLDHADEDQALLAVFLAVVHKVDRERVVECVASLLEAHPVLGEVRSGLGIVPLEIIC